MNVSTLEKATAVAALTDFLGTATNVAPSGAHGYTFQIRTDQQALANASAPVRLLILGPNTGSSINIDVGALNASGTAELDNAGRLSRVELQTSVAVLGGQSTMTFTFDHYGAPALTGAPKATDLAGSATLCADKNLDLLSVIKKYRATLGADAEPTGAQLAAAGLVRQPAAWQIQYTNDAGSSSFGGNYENPWCPGSLG